MAKKLKDRPKKAGESSPILSSRKPQSVSSGRPQSTLAWAKYALLLLSITLLAYANSFRAGWNFDDGPNITGNPAVQISDLSWNSLSQAASTTVGGRRPVSYLSFALSYYFFGEEVTGYHVVNFLIHCANALLVFRIVGWVLGQAVERFSEARARVLAFFVAALWAVSPVQTESVTYVVQRMNLLSALFSLVSFWFFHQWRQTNLAPRKRRLLAGCVISALLAFGSKENSFLLPLIFLSYEWILGKRDQRFKLKSAAVAGLVLALLAGFAVWRYDLVHRIQVDYKNRELTLRERLLTEPRIVTFYLSQLLVPLPSRLALRHEVEKSVSWLAPPTTLPAILFLGLGLGASVFLRERYPLVGFWVLWFFINLLIESSFLPLDLIYEHRVYLPSVGFFVVLVLGIESLASLKTGFHSSRMVYGLGFLVLCSAGLSLARNRDWRDPVSLWSDNARKYPNSFRSWNNLGTAYIREGQVDSAERAFRQALQLEPNYPLARINLAILCKDQGRLDEAFSLIENFQETRIGSFSADIYYNMGAIFAKRNALDQAIFHYGQAINRNPEYVEAYFNLALVYRRAGRHGEARKSFAEFLKRWPGPQDSPFVAEAQQSLQELGNQQ